MKNLELNQMEKITGQDAGQDFVGGILCGLAIGGAIGTGGWALGLAIAGCAALFGDW